MSTGASKNFATQMLPWIDMKQIYAPNSSKHLPIVPSFESIKIEYYTLTSMGHLKTLPLTKLIVLISTVCVCLIAKNPELGNSTKNRAVCENPPQRNGPYKPHLFSNPSTKAQFQNNPIQHNVNSTKTHQNLSPKPPESQIPANSHQNYT